MKIRSGKYETSQNYSYARGAFPCGQKRVRWMEGKQNIMTTKEQPIIVQTPAAGLTNEEILRYSRHLIMPEVGMEGQLKLKAAKVLLIGTGGLGAPLGLVPYRRGRWKYWAGGF